VIAGRLEDLNGDRVVNLVDFALLRAQLFQQPGPSGIPNVCD
jgi:hypothetical protein